MQKRDTEEWEGEGAFMTEEDYRLARRRALRRKRRRAARRRRRILCAALGMVFVGILCVSLRGTTLPMQNDAEEKDAPLGAEGTGLSGSTANRSNSGEDSEEILALRELAITYPRLLELLENVDEYPEELLQLALKNPEAIDYVVDYPDRKSKNVSIDLSAEAASSTVPLLLQWDERWGYEPYGSGLIGWTGCGPTCMSMLALYLTGNESYDPATVARWAEDNGYYSSGSGTKWTFFGEGSAHFGLRAKELPLVKQYMLNALDEGCLVVCAMGPGDFTTGGHYIILTGYDDEGFTVNDPNSIERSGQKWSYERLEGQISNLWSISKA